jgi:large subunit ribosomal protein L18
MKKDRKKARLKARLRVRSKIHGSQERPRVAVSRSLKNIYLQAVDDDQGITLASASSQDNEAGVGSGGGSVQGATKVGELLAKRLQEKGIKKIVYDRGGFVYHGRIKAVAEAMRKAGLEF